MSMIYTLGLHVEVNELPSSAIGTTTTSHTTMIKIFADMQTQLDNAAIDTLLTNKSAVWKCFGFWRKDASADKARYMQTMPLGDKMIWKHDKPG